MSVYEREIVVSFVEEFGWWIPNITVTFPIVQVIYQLVMHEEDNALWFALVITTTKSYFRWVFKYTPKHTLLFHGANFVWNHYEITMIPSRVSITRHVSTNHGSKRD